MADIATWKLQDEFEVIDAGVQAALSAGLRPRYEFRRDPITNASAKYSLILTYLKEPDEHEDTWSIDNIRIEVDVRKLGKELAELRVSDPIIYTTSDDSHAGETSDELEQWDRMRGRAVEYIVEGLRRDDAWHPQVTEQGKREGSQSMETTATAGSVITRTLPPFDCEVRPFYTWLHHYTSDVVLRTFPASHGYFRINPEPLMWPSQDVIHAIAFIEWGGWWGVDAGDGTNPQETDHPFWVIRLDLVYMGHYQDNPPLARIWIKAQCREPTVKVYFDELLQAIADNWVKAVTIYSGQPVAASDSDHVTLPKGELIAEDRRSIDVSTFEGLLATLDDCTCIRVERAGSLSHWKINMMRGDLPLGYVSALPVGGELWLRFYAMEWDTPRGDAPETIDEDGQLWQSARAPFGTWPGIMRDKVLDAIDTVLGRQPRVSAKILPDTDQLIAGDIVGRPDAGNRQQDRKQNKGGRHPYTEDEWAVDELQRGRPRGEVVKEWLEKAKASGCKFADFQESFDKQTSAVKKRRERTARTE